MIRQLKMLLAQREEGGIMLLTIFFAIFLLLTMIPTIIITGDIVDQRAQMNLSAQAAAYGASGQTVPGSDTVLIDAANARDKAMTILRANLGPIGPGNTYQASVVIHNPLVAYQGSLIYNPTCGNDPNPTQPLQHTIVPQLTGFDSQTEDVNSCWHDTFADAYHRTPGVSVDLTGYGNLCESWLYSVLNSSRQQDCSHAFTLHSTGYAEYTLENPNNNTPKFQLVGPNASSAPADDSVQWTISRFNFSTGSQVNCFLNTVKYENCGASPTGSHLFSHLPAGNYRFYLQLVDGGHAYNSQTITWKVGSPGSILSVDFTDDTDYSVGDTVNDYRGHAHIGWTVDGFISGRTQMTCTLRRQVPTEPAGFAFLSGMNGNADAGKTHAVPCNNPTDYYHNDLLDFTKYTFSVTAKDPVTGAQDKQVFGWTTPRPPRRWNLTMTASVPAIGLNAPSVQVTYDVQLKDSWYPGNVNPFIDYSDAHCYLSSKAIGPGAFGDEKEIDSASCFANRPGDGHWIIQPTLGVGKYWKLRVELNSNDDFAMHVNHGQAVAVPDLTFTGRMVKDQGLEATEGGAQSFVWRWTVGPAYMTYRAGKAYTSCEIQHYNAAGTQLASLDLVGCGAPDGTAAGQWKQYLSKGSIIPEDKYCFHISSGGAYFQNNDAGPIGHFTWTHCMIYHAAVKDAKGNIITPAGTTNAGS